MEISVKFTNAKEIDDMLNKMSREYGKDSLRGPIAKALDAAVEPIQADIRAATPVDTGNLQSKTYKEVYRGRGGTSAAVGYKFEGKGDVKPAISGNINEFGGKKIDYPAKRTVRKTFEKHEDKIRQRFADEFDREFEKLHKRSS